MITFELLDSESLNEIETNDKNLKQKKFGISHRITTPNNVHNSIEADKAITFSIKL